MDHVVTIALGLLGILCILAVLMGLLDGVGMISTGEKYQPTFPWLSNNKLYRFYAMTLGAAFYAVCILIVIAFVGGVLYLVGQMVKDAFN